MCEQIFKKKTAPQYNSNSLNCKNRSAIIAGWEDEGGYKKSFDELSKFVTSSIDTSNEKTMLELEKKQIQIRDRLRAQEQYTNNDCVIICNPPYDSREKLKCLVKNFEITSIVF